MSSLVNKSTSLASDIIDLGRQTAHVVSTQVKAESVASALAVVPVVAIPILLYQARQEHRAITLRKREHEDIDEEEVNNGKLRIVEKISSVGDSVAILLNCLIVSGKIAKEAVKTTITISAASAFLALATIALCWRKIGRAQRFLASMGQQGLIRKNEKQVSELQATLQQLQLDLKRITQEKDERSQELQKLREQLASTQSYLLQKKEQQVSELQAALDRKQAEIQKVFQDRNKKLQELQRLQDAGLEFAVNRHSGYFATQTFGVDCGKTFKQRIDSIRAISQQISPEKGQVMLQKTYHLMERRVSKVINSERLKMVIAVVNFVAMMLLCFTPFAIVGYAMLGVALAGTLGNAIYEYKAVKKFNQRLLAIEAEGVRLLPKRVKTLKLKTE